MKKLYSKDQKKRRIYLEFFLKHLCFKSIHQNLNFSKRYRWGAFHLINIDVAQRVRISQFKNRCSLSNRGRGVSGTLKLSRIFIRNLLSQGLISGLVKKSW